MDSILNIMFNYCLCFAGILMIVSFILKAILFFIEK